MVYQIDNFNTIINISTKFERVHHKKNTKFSTKFSSRIDGLPNRKFLARNFMSGVWRAKFNFTKWKKENWRIQWDARERRFATWDGPPTPPAAQNFMCDSLPFSSPPYEYRITRMDNIWHSIELYWCRSITINIYYINIIYIYIYIYIYTYNVYIIVYIVLV
jgi:hypothetical protein